MIVHHRGDLVTKQAQIESQQVKVLQRTVVKVVAQPRQATLKRRDDRRTIRCARGQELAAIEDGADHGRGCAEQKIGPGGSLRMAAVLDQRSGRELATFDRYPRAASLVAPTSAGGRLQQAGRPSLDLDSPCLDIADKLEPPRLLTAGGCPD